MDHRSDLSDVIVRPSATPHVSVCVFLYFPKTTSFPAPFHHNTHKHSIAAQTHAHCSRNPFISLFGLLLVRALDAQLPPPLSSSPPPPCPVLLSSSSSSSPLSLCRSLTASVFFFFLLFNLVQVVSDGGTGAALPSPRSFSNNTVSILMLIWLLQPPQHRFCLFRFLFILCLFYVFIRRAKHSGGSSRRSSAGRERKRNERGHAQKYRERRREGKAEREGGGKSRGGKGISAAAAASKPLCFRRCFSWRMVELPKGCRGRVLVL